MIPIPSGVTVWIATGHTDMRRGMRAWLLQFRRFFRKPGSPTFWRALPSTRFTGSTNCFRGMGATETSKSIRQPE